MKKHIFIISTIVAKTAIAQQPETAVWMGLQMPVIFTSKWQWHNDAGFRTIGLSRYAYQYLYRTGAKYNFNKEWNIATGLAFFLTRNSDQKSDHEFGKEFRLWHELNHNRQTNQGFSLQNRIRIEERWFGNVQNKPPYFALRFRYRLAVTEKISTKWSIQLADEYMQQYTNDNFSFNQNRLMVSAIYTFNNTAQLQFGYMWQLRPASLSQHIPGVSFQKLISSHGNK